MPNDQLEAFLSGGGEPASEQQAPPAEPTPTPAPQEAPPEAPKPEPVDEDAEPPEPLEGEPVIPRRAYEVERSRRQNWVAEAAKAAAERDMLQKQLDELKQAQPQYQQPQPIDPAQINSPQQMLEYVQQLEARRVRDELNRNLNWSEHQLRKEIGSEKVDAAVAEFKQHAEADRTLYGKLYQQIDPYGWMASEVERLRLIREVTTDPAGYEAKLRAKWEAEGGGNGQQPAPRVSPVAGLPPSLANVRSALPRSSPAYTGPQSLDAILDQRTTNAQTRH